MTANSVIPERLQGYRDEWRMSPGIVSNGLLFMTGMTGYRSDGTFSSDREEQIREAFSKVGDVLASAGLDWTRLVEMTSFHVGLRDHIDVFRSVRDEFVGEPYPAWTAIEVSGFITPGAIVEIRAVADASHD
jgi:enamine deaminase RidA (YjgF/YER057c/UK114 family)